MACEGHIEPSLVEKAAYLVFVFGMVFQKMAQCCHAFNGEAVFGSFFAKLNVFLYVKGLQVGVGNVAFAAKFKRAVKAATPCQVLVIYNKYGQVTFFHKNLLGDRVYTYITTLVYENLYKNRYIKGICCITEFFERKGSSAVGDGAHDIPPHQHDFIKYR